MQIFTPLNTVHIYILPCCSTTAARVLNPAGMDAQFERLRCAISRGILKAVKKSKKLLKFVLDDGTGEDRVILSGIHEYYEPEELVGKTCVAIVNLPPRPMMGIDSCGMLISAVHQEEGVEKLHLLMLDNHIPAGAKMY